MNQWTRNPVSIEERFWRKVSDTNEAGCRLWNGAKTMDGYGAMWVAPQLKRAHRIAWYVEHGEWPPQNKVVCHSCDTPPCVEITHLWLGDPAENTHDRHRKGRDASGDRSGQHTKPWRTARGERQGMSKLTEDDIHAIRAAYLSGLLQREIAKQWGIGQTQVSRIIRRESWSHI